MTADLTTNPCNAVILDHLWKEKQILENFLK